MDAWKEATWSQFGAAIDMLDNAIVQCPEALWADRTRRPEYWYVAFHTLFWLDLYLSKSVDGFVPPPPFTLDELDPRGLMPERGYTQAELREYLAHGRRKCRTTIAALSDDDARAPWVFQSVQGTGAEMLLYNLRHVQHHVAQLQLMLRQAIDTAPAWVVRAKS